MLPQLALGLWTVVAPGLVFVNVDPAAFTPASPEMNAPAFMQGSGIASSPVVTVPASTVTNEPSKPQGSPVPEPLTLAIVGSGLLALSLAVRKRREEEQQKQH